MRTTRAPEVVDRLLYLLRQRTDTTTTQVLDGATLSGDYKPIVIRVGYDPGRDDVIATRTGPNGMVHNDREFLAIGVLVNAFNATGSVKDARDAAAAALATLEGILTTREPELGVGEGIKLRLAETNWRAYPTTKGIESTVLCVVAGEALL